MKVKIKPINKSNWARVIKKQTACIDLKEREGVAYLIKIDEVTKPLSKVCLGELVKLADVGYYWLQIGLKDKNFWLTAMYDEKENFVQYYFDVTRKNVIQAEDSYFEDLYLDVIYLGKDKIEILDKDDLDEALNEGSITQKEYDFSVKTAEQIIANVLKNKSEYDKLCMKYFKILKKKLAGK